MSIYIYKYERDVTVCFFLNSNRKSYRIVLYKKISLLGFSSELHLGADEESCEHGISSFLNIYMSLILFHFVVQTRKQYINKTKLFFFPRGIVFIYKGSLF